MRLITIGFSCALVLCFLNNSFAFRCGSGLVSDGDTMLQVKVACGKPTSTGKSCGGRHTSTRVNKKGRIVKSNKCAGKAEIWYYNCGDNDYIYALTFENGKLSKEDHAGTGKGKSDCLGR
jgi:hypothetical protein